MSRDLTPKQRRFVEAYLGEAKGNATQAARLARYKGNDITLGAVGAENLKKPQITLAIQKAAAIETKKAIATREDMQEFWSAVMNDEDIDYRHRLKATQLLGQSQAVFVARLEVGGSVEFKEQRDDLLSTITSLAARSRADEVPSEPH